MGIIVGNISDRKELLEIYPSSMGSVYPIMLEVNETVKKLSKTHAFRPNALMTLKEDVGFKVKMGYKTVLLIESKSKIAAAVFLKKQLKLFSIKIFKEIFKYFEDEEIKVHVLTHDKTKKVISPYVSDMFRVGAKIIMYDVIVVPEGNIIGFQ